MSYLKFAKNIFFKKKAMPVYLVVFLTERCTARCRHCLLGGRIKHPDELTLDEYRKFTKTLDPILFLLITGGDVFLRDDLTDIIHAFYKKPGFLNLGIPSNGYLTDRIISATEKILSTCPEMDFAIDISIDGLGEEHDNIRNTKGIFQKAVETYKQLEKIEKRFPRFKVNIAVTISSYNHDKLDDLYEYLTKELKVKTINNLLVRGDPREDCAKDVDLEKYQELNIRLSNDSYCGVLPGYRGFMIADFINAMKLVRQKAIYRISKEDRMVYPCYAGQLSCVIYPDGDVQPCELIDHKMGNLREVNYDFRKIWFGIEKETIVDWIKHNKCHCTYECFLTNSILFNISAYKDVLKELWQIKKRN